MTNPTRQEMHRLLGELLEDCLDEQGFDRLEFLLRDDPACREYYLRAVEVHGKLTQFSRRATGSQSHDFARTTFPTALDEPQAAPADSHSGKDYVAKACTAAEQVEPPAYPFSQACPFVSMEQAKALPCHLPARLALVNRWQRPVASSTAVAIAVSACLAGCLLSYLVLGVGARDAAISSSSVAVQPAVPTVATIAGGIGADFGAGAISVGSRVGLGRLRLEEGVARLMFDKGAVVILQGPAEIDIVDAATCRLISGSMSAKIAADANAFQMVTDEFRIEEHDAEFGLTMTDAATTEVHVFDGELKLVHAVSGDQDSIHLSKGQALRLYGNQAGDDVAFNPDAFVRSDQLTRRQHLAEQRAHARWMDYSRRWSQDPAVLVRFDFEPDGSGIVRNTVGQGLHDAVSRQAMPRWISGRWNDKMAMLFDGRTDSLAVPDSANLRLKENFTLAVWLRVRSHAKNAWTRIVGKGEGADRNYGLWMDPAGHFLWQVCPDEDPTTQPDWDRVSLYTEVTPVDEWQFVVGMVDDSKLKVYVNGKLRNSAPAPRDIATSDAPLTIGHYADVPNHDEYFCGEIDEVILLNRAMTGNEIREVYEIGRPQNEFQPNASESSPSLSPEVI